MRLTGAGLVVAPLGQPLTAALLRALVTRGEPFAVKSDYRRLPPPIEELDVVHLAPGPAPARGTLVLRALDDGAFEFTRTPPAGAPGIVVRVAAVERPGMRVSLDARRWRAVGRLLALSPRLTPPFTAARDLMLRAWRPAPPMALPLVLPPAEDLIATVRAKWGLPAEVKRLVREAPAGLETWETELFDRCVAPGARVLVVGCRAGREAFALAARGFRVTGIDAVPELISAATHGARIAARTVSLHTTTAEALAHTAPGGFDAVLATSPVYEQIPGRARRLGFLDALARLCAPGGVVILCAGWHRDRGLRRGVVDATRWVLRRVGIRAAAEPGDRLTYHLSAISDHTTPCFVHAFQRPEEIARELSDAGLAAERHRDGPWLVRRPR